MPPRWPPKRGRASTQKGAWGELHAQAMRRRRWRIPGERGREWDGWEDGGGRPGEGGGGRPGEDGGGRPGKDGGALALQA